MSKISEIQEKYIRLIDIYADKNQDNSGVEAQKLIEELAAENVDDYKTAVKQAKGKLKPTQKFYTAAAERAVSAVHGNNAASAQPKPQQLNNTASPAPSTPDANTADTSAVSATSQPKKRTTADFSEIKPSTEEKLPDNIVQDLNNYLYGTDKRRPETVMAYIKADKLSALDKALRARAVIDHMWQEFEKHQVKPRVKRAKLIEMTLIQAGMPQNKKWQNDVDEKAREFLAHLAGKAETIKSVRGYITDKKDYFINDVQKGFRIAGIKTNITQDDITADHVKAVLQRLKKDEDKIAYAQILHDEKLEKFIPQELKDKLAEIRAQQPNQTDGGKPMTDDTQNTTTTDEENATAPKTAEAGNDKPEFNLTKAQAWVANKLGLKKEDYENADAMIAAINASDYIIDGDKVLIKDGSENGRLVAEYDKEKDAMVDKSAENGGKNLTISIYKPDEEDTKNLPQPIEAEPWVAKKIADYRAMETAGKITKFEPNLEIKDHFEAQVDGVSVKYSTPDNVQVSENADIKTFETILNEPDNQNRTINFAEGMPHQTAVLLKAACLLNGRNMIGAMPDFEKADLKNLAASLGAERFAALQEAINKANGQPATEKQPKTEENPNKDKAAEPKTNTADEPKRVINGAEELNKDAERLREIRQKFEGMKAYGWIEVVTDEKGKPKIEPGRQFADPQSDEAKAMVASANKLFVEAAAIVTSNKNVKGDLNDKQQADNATFNEERLKYLRDHMDKNSLEKHEAKADQVALIHAKRMGLTDEKVTRTVKEGDKFVEKEVETLKGDALNEYKSAHYADGSAMKARIDKVLQARKQSTK